MKRTNVVVDEELLERTRQLSGERTYSGALTQAMKEYVRRADLKSAIDAMRAKKDFFFPGYLEQIRPNSWVAQEDAVTAKTRKPGKKATRARSAR